jgi:hypothetical protein
MRPRTGAGKPTRRLLALDRHQPQRVLWCEVERVHPKPHAKWPSQYDELGRYKCQRPVSVGWALVVLVPLYLIAWVVL